MSLAAARTQSPIRVTLADLVRLRPAGEAVRLTAPRVRLDTEDLAALAALGARKRT